jgi:hypothetical protein
LGTGLVMEQSGGKFALVHNNFRGVAKDRTLGHGQVVGKEANRKEFRL